MFGQGNITTLCQIQFYIRQGYVFFSYYNHPKFYLLLVYDKKL